MSKKDITITTKVNDFSVRENFRNGEPLRSDNILTEINSDFLKRMENTKTKAVTIDRVKDVESELFDYISFWRWYPDLFIDYLVSLTDSPFKFFFYQRLFLRAAMRHRLFFGTFPRAFSKSFLSVMLEMVTCILYPGIKVFMTSGGKEQANGIAIEKVTEIIELIPALNNEIVWDRGEKGSKMTKDNFSLKFKNGSIFDVVAVRQSTRGGRRHSGLIDEVSNIAFKYLFLFVERGHHMVANGEA